MLSLCGPKIMRMDRFYFNFAQTPVLQAIIDQLKLFFKVLKSNPFLATVELFLITAVDLI